MFLNSLLVAYAIDAFEPIAKWLTVAIVAAAIVLCCIVFFAKRNAFAKVAKITAFAVVAYLLALAVALFALDIAKHSGNAYAEENGLDQAALIRFMLTPLLVFCAVALCSLIAFALVSKYKEAYKKTVGCVLLGVCAIALIAVLVCLAVYYDRKIDGDGYYNSDTADVEQLALYISAILTAALIVALAALDKRKAVYDARTLAYAGICVAMSYALSYIKLWDMPQGGSITLVSLLPLMLFAYIFGAKRGVFVGFAYGVLQALQDPWLIHPAQFLLDYPVAFSAVGLAGLFSDEALSKKPQVAFTAGAVIAGVLRFVCHTLSGVFAFEAYADGQNVWLYSLAYNSYVFIDAALVIVAGVFVLSSKSFVKAIGKHTAVK